MPLPLTPPNGTLDYALPLSLLNRIFLPKDDSLAEKLFHPADQRSAADSTLCS